MPLTIVIAPDKFKGSLSAPDAAAAMARGAAAADPKGELRLVPMADGGEGTVEALVAATGGTFRDAVVTGPLGEPIHARYGLLGDGVSAVIEMAAASGLVLVPPERRDPRRTTTRGTGELLLASIADGARKVIIGIGGSATNDGGAGLAQALGFRLIDAEERDLGEGGSALLGLERIEPSGRRRELDGIEIGIACDVDNPLCGPRGASAVYGPQKGATPAMVTELDAALARFARLIERDLGAVIADLPGAGAAGGLGAGLVAFAGGTLRRGVDLVIDAVGLADRLRDADLCLTGEGSLDTSSAFGKTAVGVAHLARSLGCPTLAVVGGLGAGADAVIAEGIAAYFSLCPGPITLEEAVVQAPELLAGATCQAVRAFLAGRESSTR
jgi:glycerate kinase